MIHPYPLSLRRALNALPADVDPDDDEQVARAVEQVQLDDDAREFLVQRAFRQAWTSATGDTVTAGLATYDDATDLFDPDPDRIDEATSYFAARLAHHLGIPE